MRKLLFIHDGPVFYDKYGNFYEYSYHNLYDRYHYLADDITFLMRTQSLSKETNYTPLPSEIHVVSLPNIATAYHFEKSVNQAKQILEREIGNSNYIILRGGWYGHMASTILRRLHKPYIYECVGNTWDSMWNHGISGKILALPMSRLVKTDIKNAPYVMYVTSDYLQKCYPTNGKSVGVSDVVIHDSPEHVLKNKIAKLQNIKSRRIILGTAAAIDVRYKGQEYVIKAIPKLIKNGVNVEYWLAGGNKNKSSYLQNLAGRLGVADRVKYLGSLSANEVVSFYDKIDIYVQPSKLEGLPRSVIEAMSRACPVVASNVGGIPELINDNCIFKKGNSNSFSQVLADVIQSGLIDVASRNFVEAKKYGSKAIAKKRSYFYDMFMEENQCK